jgi:hypothetical protein
MVEPALPGRRPSAFRDFAQCARTWGDLTARRQLISPTKWVGVELHFRDGTSPFIFRETARRMVTTDDPAVIVIQFRLAFLGSNPALHAAFRRECVLHTPLFAGFPGFRSKLWADDVRTGVYAGIYEWDGSERAHHYADRMVAFLAPFSTPGTARHHIVEHRHRDEFLATRPGTPDSGASAWWQLSEGARV